MINLWPTVPTLSISSASALTFVLQKIVKAMPGLVRWKSKRAIPVKSRPFDD
jgi:hypothetical protein